ncbi:hypothetical protein D9M72_543370 [compost metagenome]
MAWTEGFSAMVAVSVIGTVWRSAFQAGNAPSWHQGLLAGAGAGFRSSGEPLPEPCAFGSCRGDSTARTRPDGLAAEVLSLPPAAV